ncbi:MAG TPA: TetR/AcrR family transcriptional regulator [Terriglobales bacterium]|jgi:AcrR family transcriptional regulator
MNSVGGHSGISQPRSTTKNKKNRPLRVRNRDARERALIEAAGKLFADQGYEHTTTRQIAAKAGCAEGLISRYFQGKAGLLRKLVELQLSRKDGAPAALPPTMKEEIGRMLEEEVQRFWDDREFLKMVVPQMILDTALGRQLQDLSERRAKGIIDRLQTYDECKKLSADELSALATSIIGIGSLFGFWRSVALGHDRQHAQQMVKAMGSVIARAF